MRPSKTIIALLFLMPCTNLLAAGATAGNGIDTEWLRDSAWDDGAARISLFKGRIRWYGEWRDAEIRHYIVREYFDPQSLTKTEPPQDDSIPVLKVNILTSFETGTYPYRQMASLFYDRRTGELVKAVGSSQEGCGIAFQRWDRDSGSLVYDTYWEGEGSGSRAVSRGVGVFFENELAVLASLLRSKQAEILPSITSSSVRNRSPDRAQVERRAGVTRIGDRTYRSDADGFLEGWTVTDREEFERVSRKRLYYWLHTENGDGALLRSN
jgi:hypothetical protein